MKQTIYKEIQRINLLSKYDSSKTLNENKEIIFEQKSTYSNFPCVSKHPKAEERKTPSGDLVYSINRVFYYGNGRKVLADGTMGNYTCNDPEFKTNPAAKQVEIPKELGGNAEGVQKFQDWMDNNVPNWAEGYKDGKLSQGAKNPGFKSGGYGKFGPRTQKAWNNPTYKDRYLKSLQTPTPEGTTPEGPKGASYFDEKTGGLYKWNGTKYEFQQTYMADDNIVYAWDGSRYYATE